MVSRRICGVEQVFVGTRIAMNILLLGFRLTNVNEGLYVIVISDRNALDVKSIGRV